MLSFFKYGRQISLAGAGILVATLFSVSGCESCGKKKGVDPRQYLPQSAEAVLEVTDIGFLAKRRNQLEAVTSGVGN